MVCLQANSFEYIFKLNKLILIKMTEDKNIELQNTSNRKLNESEVISY